MTDRRQALFDAVRRACSPATWSRGVELTRAGAVSLHRQDEDEVVFLVTRRGGMISREVSLYPDDTDWDCACDDPEHGCEHAAGAVITWRRSSESGVAVRRPGRVGYRFTRAGDGLHLERVIVDGDDEEHALHATLAAVAEGRVKGPSFAAAQADLGVELALGTHRRGRLPEAVIERLFKRLTRCADIRLDGEPIMVEPEPLSARVRVEDRGDGFVLRLVDDAAQDERFANGIARSGDRLRPVHAAPLIGRELETLSRGRGYGLDQVAELVTEVIPALRRRIPVDIVTERLPETTRERPRVDLALERKDETLSVLPTLVYGDPPRARIDGGRLIHLGGAVPVRDVGAEKRVLRRLHRELGLQLGVRREFRAAEAVAFAARLERWGKTASPALAGFKIVAPLDVDLQIGDGSLDLTFSSAGGGGLGGGTVAAEAVLQAWSRGEPLVPLLEGGWAPLPVDWLERYGARIADLLAARHEDGSLPPCVLPDLARLCDELGEPAPPSFDKLRALIEGGEIADESPPDDLRAELRPYQHAGVNWLRLLRSAGLGGLLADDMGLGKTIQALCALEGRSLVVAPASVLHNWRLEIEKFRPALSCHIYHGPGRKLDPQASVSLTTYTILRLDASSLAAGDWDTVVLDEAQAIKNPDSQVARAAFSLPGRFKLAMTGTPVENRLEELWSQFHFINRGLLGSRADFDERYARPIGDGDGDAAARLRERIRPFVLRRLKTEVARDLPPRTEMLLHCDLDEEERAAYDAVRAATLSDVVQKLDAGGSVMAALEALLRLRQAACHRGLLPGNEASDSSKLALLREVLDSVVAEGRKALVFSQWTSLLDLTEPGLRSGGIDYLRLDGSTRDRQAVVDAFQDEGGPPVLLISLKAGGTGLNLTAADHVFLLDPWWNPAVEDQAADRAHRIGQTRPVMIYRLVAEATVEERILALQERKRELAGAALGEADGARGIGRAELLELLRD